jgi:thiol-disulfide isomerase/thioredoxin
MTEFIELNDDSFESTLQHQKVALIDYMASWCGACRLAAPMYKRVAASLGIPIFKVDAEKNPIARSHATIATLPTIAVVKDGEVVAAMSTTKEEGLREFLAEHGVR